MKTPTSKVLDQKTSLLLTQIYKNKGDISVLKVGIHGWRLIRFQTI